jgi:Transglutaminase-like superfamily
MRRLPARPGERALAVRVAVTVVAVKLGLRWVALPRLMRCLTPRRPLRFVNPALLEPEIRYTNATLARLRHGGRRACLPRSLALYRLARRRGVAARLHCGVRRNGVGLIGHAWLTVDGVPLLPSEETAEWIETYTYPPGRERQVC